MEYATTPGTSKSSVHSQNLQSIGYVMLYTIN